MRRVVVPKKSHAHRVAFLTRHALSGLALYRALLRQCNSLQQSRPDLVSPESHVRERFRRYKNLQSPSQTANALRAGYEALDLVYSAAQGDKEDIGRLTKLLSEVQLAKERKRQHQNALAAIRPVKELNKKQVKAEENRRFQTATAQRHPEARPILERPRAVVSGKRRIPTLVNASGIPFLRISKPQPQSLSRLIRGKIVQRQKWIDRRDRLELEVLFCKDEDQWDDLTTGCEDGEQWSSALRTAIHDIRVQIREDNEKRAALAKSMWNIVLAERELAEKEKQAEEKLAEEKLAEEKLAEQKQTEQKLAEQKLAEQKLAEQKPKRGRPKRRQSEEKQDEEKPKRGRPKKRQAKNG
ncbi:uncharacterized protein DSM5745_01468 [Aspergillus mulundensis]|uniref:Complex 1 LYR protein domain-containing protein n=1 Tax=Aspergillus mulundensis TaxID=1810919 RepID=A0A3D8T6F4_9EURO|nr:hypothetical protein DSM5745_01468 [Aspergillus mulundensis]RDW94146.1 hypothetical protein DSM5745_01468 [Aspergillus mulundensis]